MNPQEQPTPPTNNNQLTPESDAAALQAIEALESEEVSVTEPLQPTSVPTPDVASAPVEAATSLEPVEAPQSIPTQPPVVGGQTTSTPDTSPVEPSAAGVAAGLGAQAATNSPVQTPSFATASTGNEKKKTNKGVVILLIAVLVVVAVAAGYFVWQSM